MRTRGRLLLLPLLAMLLVAAFSCGDGGADDSSTFTPTSSPPGATTRDTDTPGVTPSPDEKETPTPDNGEETPPPEEPTPPPTATEGTPAVAPEDQAGFVARFQGQAPVEDRCLYNPGTRLADCDEHGRYAVDPPLAGQDISCAVLLLNGAPAAVRCTSQEPLKTLYYEIKG